MSETTNKNARYAQACRSDMMKEKQKEFTQHQKQSRAGACKGAETTRSVWMYPVTADGQQLTQALVGI